LSPSIIVGLNAVIVAVTDEEPRLLTVERAEHGMLARPRAIDVVEPFRAQATQWAVVPAGGAASAHAYERGAAICGDPDRS